MFNGKIIWKNKQKLGKARKSWVKCEKVWTNAKRFVVAAACGNKKLILCENLQLLPCVSEIMLKIFMFEINNSVRD